MNEFSGNSSPDEQTGPAIHVAPKAPRKISGMNRQGGCRVLMLLVVAISSAVAAAAGETTVQQAVDQVQRETSAKVLSVQTLQVGKRKIYRIKLLTPEGRVRVVDVKANE
ncbi:MAG: PepSY domain-containing protein [Xanthomonadales bacterium]|nr:PepSY domain-containing protein [Xanthomonadales bacterium]